MDSHLNSETKSFFPVTPREIGYLQFFESVLGNFACSWILKDFSLMDATLGTKYESQRFMPEEPLIWFLQLSPSGQSEADDVCCDLRCSNRSGNLSLSFVTLMKCRISFQNTEGETLESLTFRDARCIFFSNTSPGIPISIPRGTLIHKLPDDTLVVLVEGTYFTPTGSENTKFSYGVSPHAKLADDFLRSWLAAKRTDAVITVDTTDIPVHSAILAGRSRVFAAMFRNDTLERSSRNVLVVDFDVTTVKGLLQFIYSGTVAAFDTAQAIELLRAADKYEIVDLKVYCTQFLVAHLDDSNFARLLVCADMFNATKLKSKAIEYFREHKCSVDIESHRDLLRLRPSVLCDLIKVMQKV